MSEPAPNLPADGQIKLHPALIAREAHEAVGERRNFQITETFAGDTRVQHFTGRLAYDADFNLTVVDIRPAA